VIHCF